MEVGTGTVELTPTPTKPALITTSYSIIISKNVPGFFPLQSSDSEFLLHWSWILRSVHSSSFFQSSFSIYLIYHFWDFRSFSQVFLGWYIFTKISLRFNYNYLKIWIVCLPIIESPQTLLTPFHLLVYYFLEFLLFICYQNNSNQL